MTLPGGPLKVSGLTGTPSKAERTARARFRCPDHGQRQRGCVGRGERARSRQRMENRRICRPRRFQWDESGLQLEHDAHGQHRDQAQHIERCATFVREHLIHGRVEQPDGRGYAGALNQPLPTISSQQTNGTATAASCATYGISPPSVTITTPPNGATYSYGQVVDAEYLCTAALGATLKSCTGTVPNGTAISTTSGRANVLGDRGRHRRAAGNRHRSLHGHRGAPKSDHLAHRPKARLTNWAKWSRRRSHVPTGPLDRDWNRVTTTTARARLGRLRHA